MGQVANQSQLLEPIHPGKILAEDVMKPLGLSIENLAAHLRLDRSQIQAIVKGTDPISPDAALRLATYFGVTAETWLTLQSEYDRRLTRTTPTIFQHP